MEAIQGSTQHGWMPLFNPLGPAFPSVSTTLDLRGSDSRLLLDLEATITTMSWAQLYHAARIKLEWANGSIVMVHWDRGFAPPTNGRLGQTTALAWLGQNDPELLAISSALNYRGRSRGDDGGGGSSAAAASSSEVTSQTTRGKGRTFIAVDTSEHANASSASVGLVGSGRRPGAVVVGAIRERHFTSILARGEESAEAESHLESLLCELEPAVLARVLRSSLYDDDEEQASSLVCTLFSKAKDSELKDAALSLASCRSTPSTTRGRSGSRPESSRRCAVPVPRLEGTAVERFWPRGGWAACGGGPAGRCLWAARPARNPRAGLPGWSRGRQRRIASHVSITCYKLMQGAGDLEQEVKTKGAVHLGAQVTLLHPTNAQRRRLGAANDRAKPAANQPMREDVKWPRSER